MRVGAATAAQVRIGRDKVDSLMQLIMGGRAQLHPEAVLSRVLTVRLRAPDGGFAIEPVTPETQWIDAGPGVHQDENVGWRWTVTPQRRGRRRLLSREVSGAERSQGHQCRQSRHGASAAHRLPSARENRDRG